MKIKKREYIFTKRILAMCIITLFFASLCNGQRKKDEIFPLQKLTGNTDGMLGTKYRNADTANFQKLEQLIRYIRLEKTKKDIINIQKKRNKYPKIKINNIVEATQWIEEVCSSHNFTCSYCGYSLSHYKQVEDGFLMKGRYIESVTDDKKPFCERKISLGMFLVGYDHNILHIKSWTIDPCPNKLYVNVEVHLPEFENTEIRYPELSGSSIDSFLLKNIKYPLYAQENGIQGKVLVSFIVETDGSVSNIKIVKSIDKDLPREVVRCVKLTNGKWISGMKNGEKTPIEMEIEFVFDLGDYGEAYNELINRILENRQAEEKR